ncbi:hypothetical protein HDU76_003448 [Blyttiomyces sp. JEL0837]|nr:hypothetical protein HDU76_003448 [Blyttiomyces sp. JEL0837]
MYRQTGCMDEAEDDGVETSIQFLENFPQDEFPELYKPTASRQRRMRENIKLGLVFPLSKLLTCLLSIVISSGIDKQSLLEIRRNAQSDDS